MADFAKEQEKLLQDAIRQAENKIKRIYQESISEISLKAALTDLKNKPFALSLYPLLDKTIEAQVDDMHRKIYRTIVDNIKKSWDLSNRKNDKIIDKRLASKKPSVRKKQIMYDPNKGALDQFLSRKEKGLNLSDRVWNSLGTYKKEMEQGLGISVGKGQSAISMATDLKKFLNNPDKLFRRVRGDDGKLKLSKAAREFKPGKGVYRSSYKNALRLSRTENNIAYRTADFTRWQNLPFVLGFEVRVSKNHPDLDICDHLAGVYPKTFKFTGWHPNCLCYMVSKMMSDDQFDALEDEILGIAPESTPVEGITELPQGFKDYWNENQKKIAGWSNEPYWLRDNKNLINGITSPPVPTPALVRTALPGTAGAPGGNSIKAQLTNIDKKIQNSVNEALAAIDQVHGDGTLKNIPFEQVSGEKYEAALMRDPKTLHPKSIKVSDQAKGPAISVVHEMGHYLDSYAIGRKGIFTSEEIGSVFDGFLRAANDTDAIKELRRRNIEGTFMKGGEQRTLSPKGFEHTEYLLEPKEIWARAYAQYIATRSGSTILKQDLEKSLLRSKDSGIPYQWDEKDFVLMGKEMDKLMIKLKWINPK
jgi:hypothetical protein